MLVSFRLMALAALLTIVSWCLGYLWMVLDSFLGPSLIAYLAFFVTSFGLLSVFMFTLSLLGVFADEKFNLS